MLGHLSLVVLSFFGVLVAAQNAGGNLAYSPPFYPSPWMKSTGEWSAAYEKAKSFVGQLTLLEKVNITTGMFLFYLHLVHWELFGGYMRGLRGSQRLVFRCGLIE